ncbi:alpha/beta hydrolase [Brevundimonas sp. FT23042]|uniref:alpha/beta hydrolase n=1 Tax=Brevundimonas sp. FT23042 TaxID=3393749 RepID=UPI003B5881B7
MIRRAVLTLALMLFATPLAAQTPGTAPVGETFTVASPLMGKDRELNVLLPDGYEAGAARYPVIYILDGGQAQDFPTYAAMIRQAARDGQMQPVIVVGVASEDRQNELTERARDRQIITRWPNHGQSERFRQFLTDEVKPWVETRYRTDGEDAVLGESAAALFIVEAFLEQPTLFDRYLAISPSLWWDREALSKRAAGLLAAHPAGDRLLLLSIADEGGQMQSGLNRLMLALDRAGPQGLHWRYEPRHDLEHSTIYQAVAPLFVREAFPVTETPAP